MDFLNEILNYQKSVGQFIKEYQLIFVAVLIPAFMFGGKIIKFVFTLLRNSLILNVNLDESYNVSGPTYYAIGRLITRHRIKALTKYYEMDVYGKLRLGPGLNAFKYNNAWIWIRTSRRESKGNSDAMMGTGTISFFRWNLKKFEALLEELAEEDRKDKCMIGFGGPGGCWDQVGNLTAQLGQQIQYIDNACYNAVDKVMDRFTNDLDYYTDRNLPHKETFLLYGPPGTGKTNLIRHFAAKYELDLLLIDPMNINRVMFTRSRFQINGERRPIIYLLEDIDSNSSLCMDNNTRTLNAISKDKKPDLEADMLQPVDDFSSYAKDDLSTLLNALDGIVPVKDAIVIMTTNFPSKLYKSIYRLGRVDHRVSIDYMSFNEVIRLLNWTADDARYQRLLSSEFKDKLPANAINRLTYAQQVSDVEEILADIQRSFTLDEIIC